MFLQLLEFDLFGCDVGLQVTEPVLDLVGVLFLFLERDETFFVGFEVCGAILSDGFDVVEGFGVPSIVFIS